MNQENKDKELVRDINSHDFRLKSSIMQNAYQHWLKADTTLDFEEWINKINSDDDKPKLSP